MFSRTIPASKGGSPIDNHNHKMNSPSSAAPDERRHPADALNGEGAVLIGKGTRITGEFNDCSIVEIQGALEGNVSADAVVIREGGAFKGEMKTKRLEVHGTIEGKIEVEGLLDIRATGTVIAELTYGQLCVQTGGTMAGEMQTKAMADRALQSETVHSAETIQVQDVRTGGGMNGHGHHHANGRATA